MKTVYYVAASLDGFIADSGNGVGWLDKLEIQQDASGYSAFFAGVDGLLMGRKTYDFVFDYGHWPYGAKPTWVCTTRNVTAIDGCDLQPDHDADAAILAAEKMGLESLWVVGGGRLARTLIQAGRLTHLSVAVMPVLLFEGCALVDVLPRHQYLKQTSATEMNGFTQIEYELDASSSGRIENDCSS